MTRRRRHVLRPPRPRRNTAQLALVLMFLAPPAVPSAFAAPMEGEPNDQVRIETEGNLTTIVAEDQAIIRWAGGFNIAEEETVVFIQPNAHSEVVNYDRTGMRSEILGMMTANGKVYLVNPMGVFIGEKALIDVGGLVAAAGNIDEARFFADEDLRTFDLKGRVEVRPNASITGNIVALLGLDVLNNGDINALGGAIALVAGDQVTLTSIGSHISVSFTHVMALDPGTGVTNTGNLEALGGEVTLTTGDFYSAAINHTGMIEAREILLDGDAGSVHVENQLDASDTSAGATGGNIEIRGSAVELVGAVVAANGDAGGGALRIGSVGDGETPATARTSLDAGTTLQATALSTGDGGTAEISGDALVVDAHIDLSSEIGAAGTETLSARDIEIVGGDKAGQTGSEDPFRIFESEIEGKEHNLVLQAKNGITTNLGTNVEPTPEVQVQADLDLTLTTRNADADASSRVSGIDLTALDFATEGGDIVVRTGTAELEMNTNSAPLTTAALTSGGGNLTLATARENSDIHVTGTLDSTGPADAGAVDIEVARSGNITIGDIVSAGAPNGEAMGRGGDGGNVAIVSASGDITTGNIDTTGGNSSGEMGSAGSGGNALLDTPAGKISTANLDLYGGASEGTGSAGGNGGALDIASAVGESGVGVIDGVTIGRIDTHGGDGVESGGTGGNVGLASVVGAIAGGDVTISGGAGTDGANAGTFLVAVTGASGVPAESGVSFGDITAVGGEGLGTTDAEGVVSGGLGGLGGVAKVGTADGDISVGSINASGGKGALDGGVAGIFAVNSNAIELLAGKTGSIEASGDLNAIGGEGVDGTGGLSTGIRIETSYGTVPPDELAGEAGGILIANADASGGKGAIAGGDAIGIRVERIFDPNAAQVNSLKTGDLSAAGGEATLADGTAIAGDGAAIIVSASDGAVTVGKLDSDGGLTGSGARGTFGGVRVENFKASDLPRQIFSKVRLEGQILARGHSASAEENFGVIIRSSGQIEGAIGDTTSNIIADASVELGGRGIGNGPSSPLRIGEAGTADPAHVLVVKTGGPVDIKVDGGGFAKIDVRQDFIDGNISIRNSDDAIEILGDAAGTQSTVSRIETALTKTELEISMNVEGKNLVVDPGSTTLGADAIFESAGDLVVRGNASLGAGIDVANQANLTLRAETGDILGDSASPGDAVLSTDGDLRLEASAIRGQAGDAFAIHRPAREDDLGVLRVVPTGVANIAVSEGAFDAISIRQGDASRDVDFVQSGDAIDIHGEAGQSVLANVSTTHRFRYILESQTLENEKIVIQSASFGADTLIRSVGDVLVENVSVENSAALTLQADNALGDIKTQGAGEILLADDASLLLSAKDTIGSGDAALFIRGGGDVSAVSDKGIFLATDEAAGFRVAEVQHADPITGAALSGPDPGLGLQVRDAGAIGIGGTGSALLASDLEAAAGNTEFAADVILETDVAISSVQAVFNGALDSRADEAHGLTIVGAATFGADVGAASALASLAVSGETVLDGTLTVTTSGAQNYSGNALVTTGSTATLRSTDAAVAFGSTLEGPGTAIIEAGTTASFGGDIGSTTRLEGLDVSADFIDFSGATSVATDAGGIALNSDGRSSVPEAATMGSTNGDLSFDTMGAFKMGRREKLSVVGRLEIIGKDVTSGDLSALELEIDAENMTVLGRERGGTLRNDGVVVNDRGTDLVANVIALNHTAASWDGLFERPSLATPRGDVSGGSLTGVDNRLLDGSGQLILAQDLLALPTLLDLAGTGGVANPATETPPSEIAPVALAPQMEQVDPPQTQSLPVFAARTTPTDLLEYLRCAAVAAQCLTLVDASAFDDGVLGGAVAQRAAELHRAVFGDAISARERREDLRGVAEASSQGERLDGRRMLRGIASPQHAAAKEYLVQLRVLLEQISLLNLTSEAAAAVRASVLSEALDQLGIAGLSAAQLEAATGQGSSGLRL